MNFARAITTLARNSALDPEPSSRAVDAAEEIENTLFRGQDDYSEWTSAFRRRFAQLIDRSYGGVR